MKLAALLLIALVPLAAQPKAASSFDAWWKQFQAAVVKKDAATVTKGSRFPMQWENGPTRDVKTAAEMAARFDVYFTPEIKNSIARRKPVSDGQDTYTITWKARGNEYSLYFKRSPVGWAFDGLSEGPP